AWFSSCWSSFFFQAEDGIRDFHVTGVQTCALPICLSRKAGQRPGPQAGVGSSSCTETSDFPIGTSIDVLPDFERNLFEFALKPEIGRASCRERVELSVVTGGLWMRTYRGLVGDVRR